MDGVLADAIGHMLKVRNGGDGLSITDFTEWHIGNRAPEGNGIYQYFHLPNIFRDAEPIPGAIEGVMFLFAHGHDVVLVTALPADSHNAYHQKIQWAREHLGIDDQHFVATHNKGLVRGDILIDDRPDNLDQWKKENPAGLAILYPQPWNTENWHGDYERQWKEIVAEILQWTEQHTGG
jgi:5'(3')-deoxyribonucleotidase